MLSNLATLRKHLEMVFVQHILLCFNRRCQGSSFTATQDCRRCWERVPLPAFKKRKKENPRYLLLPGQDPPRRCDGASHCRALWVPSGRRGLPMPRLPGRGVSSSTERGRLHCRWDRVPPVLQRGGTALCSPLGLKALPSKSHAVACDKL